MGAFRRLSEARLRTILKRQDPPSFGAAYQPSIRAVREEAPSLSRFAEVWSELLGRYVSTLSTPERMVLIIILYCPHLFELHEQRMLPCLPALHPLQGHPRATGQSLQGLRGTINVAEEIGALGFHPTVRCKSKVDGAAEEVPFPWIGDFLLFLEDSGGAYCNNITVKLDGEAFDRPTVGVKPRTDLLRAEARERARHKVEAVLYSDAGIPTIRALGSELNRVMVSNLEQIYGWCKRRHPFSEGQELEIVERFKEGVIAQISALEVMHHLSVSHGHATYDMKVVMYRAIWARRIRIDLYKTFFIDHPLQPERIDVLSEFAHWFKRY